MGVMGSILRLMLPGAVMGLLVLPGNALAADGVVMRVSASATGTFGSIQAAYDDPATADRDELRSVAGVLGEHLVLGRPLAIRLAGGYDPAFQQSKDPTTINGLTIVSGSVTLDNLALASAACGNGAPESGEACDDGNTLSGDGCSAACTVESGYVCSSAPSVCRPACDANLLAADLQHALEQVVTDADFSYAVERSDGKLFTYNRGTATMTTSFESASTSKLVTAVIIVRLVEQGYLSLDSHPQDFIPTWPIAANDPLHSITLAQLLSFTSGLTAEPLCLNLGLASFSSCVDAIATTNAANGITPGREFYYASTHLQVAGLMAMNARGVDSWQALFNEFRSQTGLFPNGSYDLPSLGNPRLAGGMHWTGNDYLAFLRALAGGQLLNASTMTEMLMDRTGAGVSIVYSPARAETGEDWHYGFGFWHECQNPVFNCAPARRISSPGTYGAYPFWDLVGNYYGIVARQGGFKTGFNGVSVERAVRPQAEAWLACP